ncbi:uncharacterized protein LOC104583445 isoform X1 [Brachypodium distachyon]|uniref:uncharacterized protein LOC104583445 isoform X1 n=1 Tax=Brachypodium distachyon TaxID=15368 RepID=UPI00052FF7FA|nr:uncharacterized protein LOC104583445 isoform X1 [Brachypodium distachyon]|eukprot:XP_010233927.1 uncharacterized protein LOC104583445 isoform X1 [Brachypodium distachyon]
MTAVMVEEQEILSVMAIVIEPIVSENRHLGLIQAHAAACKSCYLLLLVCWQHPSASYGFTTPRSLSKYRSSHFNISVGDLCPEVTDAALFAFFLGIFYLLVVDAWREQGRAALLGVLRKKAVHQTLWR